MATSPLVADIFSATSDANVRRSMLLGALLEGGSYTGPWNSGDHGTSGGPFQIHWTVHPDVVAEARRRGISPEQLVNDPKYAVQYMEPEYQAAAAKVGTAAFAGDPEHAAERTAYLAERPAQDYYTTRGASTVGALYSRASAAAAGGGVGEAPTGGGTGVATIPDTQFTGSGGGSSSAAGTTQSHTGVIHVHIPIPWAPDVQFDIPWLRVLFAVLGLGLFVMGLKLLAAGSGADAKPTPVPVPV